jgi:uncharacterized protein
MKHVAFVVGDPEYLSHTTMPGIAEEVNKRLGHKTSLCVTSIVPDEPDFALSEFSNLDGLASADLMVIYTRFRVLPDRQMEQIKSYLDSGRPVIGLRTSTHSFHFPDGSRWQSWNDGFGRDVLATPWISHHGHSSRTDVSVIQAMGAHPILKGMSAGFRVRSWLYHVLPLAKPCEQLLWGRPIDPECAPQENPVAWTTTHKGGRVFYTSLGHPDDFKILEFRTLLLNAVQWALALTG